MGRVSICLLYCLHSYSHSVGLAFVIFTVGPLASLATLALGNALKHILATHYSPK